MLKDMYKSRLIGALVVTLSCGFASCSSNEDDPQKPAEEETETTEESVIAKNIKEIMPKGIYTTSADSKVTMNSDGTVAKIEEGEVITSFQYLQTASRDDEPQVRMTVKIGDYGTYIYDIFLNDKGFAKKAIKDGRAVLTFAYDSNNQLTKATCDGRNYTVTYNNGDIVKVSKTYDFDSPDNESQYGYTNANHANPIDNIGGVMVWYHVFEIDIDQFEPAYNAGLLGKGTKHLPLTGGYYNKYEWTLNTNNLPIKMVAGDDNDQISYTFKW